MPQRQNEPGFFRQWNEHGGQHQPAVRMLPAHQGFGTGGMAFAVGLALVMDAELVALQALAQFGLELDPGVDHGLHLRVEEADRVAARRLGLVHRQVCAFEQFVDVADLLVEQGNADARGGMVLVVIEFKRRRERRQDFFRDRLGLAGDVFRFAAETFQQDDELVAAVAGHRVASARHARPEAQRNLLQQHVALVVAERVVEALEAVEVDEQHAAGVPVAPA